MKFKLALHVVHTIDLQGAGIGGGYPSFRLLRLWIQKGKQWGVSLWQFDVLGEVTAKSDAILTVADLESLEKKARARVEQVRGTGRNSLVDMRTDAAALSAVEHFQGVTRELLRAKYGRYLQEGKTEQKKPDISTDAKGFANAANQAPPGTVVRVKMEVVAFFCLRQRPKEGGEKKVCILVTLAGGACLSHNGQGAGGQGGK